MRKISIIIFILAAFLLPACVRLFSCEYKVAGFVDSPFHQKSIVWIEQNCGATTAFVDKYYIVGQKKAHSLSKEEDPSERLLPKRSFLNVEYGGIETEWVSKNEINVYYDVNAEFFKQDFDFEGVQINYIQRSDDVPATLGEQ